MTTMYDFVLRLYLSFLQQQQIDFQTLKAFVTNSRDSRK